MSSDRIGRAAPTPVPFPDEGDRLAPRPLRHFLSGAPFGIRPGEGWLAWLFFVYFLMLATCHYVGKSVRLATYVDSLGATQLPYAYLLVALVSFPVLALYTRLASRLSQPLLIGSFCVVQAAGLVAFFWLYSLEARWVPLAFYVWTTVAFGVGVSQFWSYANHVFDSRQARRLFAFVGAGGLLGAIPGGQIASLAGRFSGTRVALLVAAGLSLLLAVVVRLIETRRPPRPVVSYRELTRDRLEAARGGLHAVRSSRLLTLIAVLVFLSMLVDEMVDLQFGWVIEGATTALDQRTMLFGNFFSIMGVTGFLFQILFTQRIHRARGVGVGMRILPLSIAITGGPLAVAFATGLTPPIWTAYLLKLSENSFRHSVDQSTRELLFLPVPSAVRLQAKSFIDIFVQRSAKGVAAVALMPIALGLLSAGHLTWIIIGVAVTWLWTCGLVRREYVRAFREGLKTGVMDGAPSIDTRDATTLTMLVESLGSSDPRLVLHSLELLSAHGLQRLVPPLLLHHDNAEVRRATLDVLAAADRTDAVRLIESLMSDDDPQVRSSAIQALATLKGEDAWELMADRLSDPDPRLRSAAVASLMSSRDGALQARAAGVLDDMLGAREPAVRVEAAKALAEIEEPEGSRSLVQVLYDQDIDVVRQAIASVRRRMERDGPNPLYIPILISLMGDRRLKHAARAALVAYGERAIQALVLFMNADDEQIWVRRAVPKTIALIGSDAAATGLVGSLGVRDTFLRHKIIDALAYLRGRHPATSFAPSTVSAQIRLEVGWYLRAFADLWTMSSLHEARFDGPRPHWQASGRVPTLLQQVLAHRMTVAVDNIFGLLALIHPPHDVQAAYHSLMSGHPSLRANALEYLDNTLRGGLRRDVFAVIDDAPVEEKLHKASQLLAVEVEPPEQTLGRLLTLDPEQDPASTQIVFAAIHTVFTDRVERYYSELVEVAANHSDPMLRETAGWVLRRLGQLPADGLAVARDDRRDSGAREYPVSHMTQIEKVVFLQSVDLFSSCNAEQLLQMAAIASDRQLQPSEVVYRRDEAPNAMYCVVDGRVSLGESRTDRVVVERYGTFGVVDILSGQLRSREAAAELPSTVLVIEAEDLFDLLSNNIDIVRALFRQLTRAPVGTWVGPL